MYVIKTSDQQDLLRRLIPTGILDGGWTKLFKDPSDNTEWVLYYHHGERQGGGYRVLRSNPVPKTLSEWMNKCFFSDSDDDVIGLAWELSSEYQRWPEVMDWLEQNVTGIDLPHTQLFVKHLEVLNIINRRPINGKSPQEIKEDYHFFQNLAQRAKDLIGSD